jgi:hypothetical protein
VHERNRQNVGVGPKADLARRARQFSKTFTLLRTPEAANGEMWAERLPLDLEANRRTAFFDVVLQQLELWRRLDADPHDSGSPQVRERSDTAQPHGHRPVSPGNLVHGGRQLWHQGVGLFAKELESEV